MNSYSVRTTRLHWKKLALVIIIIAIGILLAAILAIRQSYIHNLQPISGSQKAQLVTIPSGSSAHDIGVILEKDGVIKKAWAFEWYIRNHDLRDKLLAGTYALRPNQSVSEIATEVTKGEIATNLVTVLPGQRLDQIRKALNNAGFSSSDVDYSLNPDLYKDHPALIDKPPSANLEGYLYPDSYQRTTNSKSESIIKASLDQMELHLTPAIRQGIAAQGLTLHQGIILASIVEQEVSKADDRPVVAQVFLKRLQQGMVLGSDVTAIYGSIIANQTPSLTYNSPYNTLINKGLPPGPISNVVDSSLKAVANPAKTDYLFFVAGDDGVTYFSHTLDEHQALTKEHCKKLCNQ